LPDEWQENQQEEGDKESCSLIWLLRKITVASLKECGWRQIEIERNKKTCFI